MTTIDIGLFVGVASFEYVFLRNNVYLRRSIFLILCLETIFGTKGLKNERAGQSTSSFQVAGQSAGTRDDYVPVDDLGSNMQRLFSLGTIDGHQYNQPGLQGCYKSTPGLSLLC